LVFFASNGPFFFLCSFQRERDGRFLLGPQFSCLGAHSFLLHPFFLPSGVSYFCYPLFFFLVPSKLFQLVLQHTPPTDFFFFFFFCALHSFYRPSSIRVGLDSFSAVIFLFAFGLTLRSPPIPLLPPDAKIPRVPCIFPFRQ